MPELTTAAKDVLKSFKKLPRAQRSELLVEMARDKRLSQDILDLATIANRRNEPSRPFREYLAEKSH